MIRIEALTKRYGSTVAINDLTVAVEPGQVTALLGPNGAGKTTAMRVLVGLDRPTAGRATIGGRLYASYRAPMREVGVLLDAHFVHPGRSAYAHLRALAATHGIPKTRVHEVIGIAGLESVARDRVGRFSLGTAHRLGVAAAILGDPQTLVLDEPMNGLDADGVLWVRSLARSFAAEGRTVFLSSHLMSEVAPTADHLIIIGRGRLLADLPIGELLAGPARLTVRVRSPQLAALVAAIEGAGVTVNSLEPGVADVAGLTAQQIGAVAAADGIVLHELTERGTSLDEAYMELTKDAVEFRSGAAR